MGGGYAESVKTLVILLGATFMIFFGALYSNILIVINRQKTLAYIYFWGMLGNVVANLYIIPRWSYLGASWSTLATEIAVTAAMIGCLYAYGWFAADMKKIPGIMFASVGMAAILYWFRLQPLSLQILVGCVGYGALLLVTGAVKKNELFGARLV